MGAVRDPDRLLLDDRPRLRIRIQREEVGVAVEGEDDVLKDVSHG